MLLIFVSKNLFGKMDNLTPKPLKLPLLEINNASDWLKVACAINIAWHDHERYAREVSPNNSAKHEYYCALAKALLIQKNNALLSALSTAYHNGVEHGLWLFFDGNERGYDNNGEFYRLTWQGQVNGGCHLPKAMIDECLTNKQKLFFGV